MAPGTNRTFLLRLRPECPTSGEGRRAMPTPQPPGPALVLAALANEDIQEYLADPKLAGIWTREGPETTPGP